MEKGLNNFVPKPGTQFIFTPLYLQNHKRALMKLQFNNTTLWNQMN